MQKYSRPYVDVFDYEGVSQFVREAKMVSKLLSDIERNISARDRWLPNFVENLAEIEDVLNDSRFYPRALQSSMGATVLKMSPVTNGQQLVLKMCEKLRKRLAFGLSLKTFIYALSLITRFAHDGNLSGLCSLLTY